ncbi:MAG: hypothetical protein BWZ10_02015 [candidate division BRC1 bacterium ADurb.BinA364]|nr:MAG: hypothetical protein BWZ10_02015 [candidate division BRC1 bacterium ADurb.BinA364]
MHPSREKRFGSEMRMARECERADRVCRAKPTGYEAARISTHPNSAWRFSAMQIGR